ARRNFQGQKKIAVDIWPVSRNGIGLVHLDYDVGLTKSPRIVETRSRWQVAGLALSCSLRYPASDQINLVLAQPAFADKLAVAFHTFPGRHKTAARNLCDLPSAFTDVRIIEQRKRSHFTRPMTRNA